MIVGTCWPAQADNIFGPRVDVACRAFDFTLLFEDISFTLLPAACFLLLLPMRLFFLRHETVKVKSIKLAVCKLCILAVLLVLQILFTAYQVRSLALYTRFSLPAAIVTIITTFAASYASFLEDQRSVRPSDLLVLYFSASSICKLPQLRSLWLIPSTYACRYLSLASFFLTVAISILESVPKTRILHPEYSDTTEEEKSGFWNRTFFIWVLPFLRTGYGKSLEVKDVPPVDADLQGQFSGAKLRRAWDSGSRHHGHRLIKAVSRAYGWIYISAIPPRLAYSCFTFAQPFLITAAINYIGGSPASEPKPYGAGLVGAYLLVYLGLAVTKAVYWRQTYRLLTRMRSGLITMIYDQTLALTAVDLDDSAAITLMGTDVERIVANLKNLHEAWASTIEIGIAIWLLERELSIACFIPLVISLASVVMMVPVSSRSGQAQKEWIERVQKRLAVTATVLGNMKAVQMLGLNTALFPLIARLRKVEVKTSARFRKLLIWQVALSNVPVVFAPFLTFTIYDHSSRPLLIFCQVMPAIWQAIACFGRIELYCAKETSSNTNDEQKSSPHLSEKFPLLSFQIASIAWSLEKEPVFQNLSCDIKRGITMIVGSVGCGKSTLIEALLNDYMTPWIWNDTIRNNIVGFQKFDQAWYDFTCTACGLQQDFQALTDGDMHLAGSDGISLSGGQKQRIALARAVYSRVGVVILDNVLSGVDSKNIALISRQLLGRDGHFRKAGISVILATTTYELLPLADGIVIMNDGGIEASGTYEEIVFKDPQIIAKTQTAEEHAPVASMDQVISPPSLVEKKEYSGITVQVADDEGTISIKRHGVRSVYAYYFRSAGRGLVIAFLSFTFVEAFCSSFQTIWIQWWVEANATSPNHHLGMYLGVYGMIFGLTFLSLVAGCWLLFVRCLNNTSLRMHSDLLRTTLGASISFFQYTDSGSILNRFSQDLELIDMMLPIYAVNCATNIMNVCINVIIICVIGKYLAVTIPFLGVVLFFVQSYYLRTSRQVRLLDIEAKAPLFTHFREIMHDIPTIRAFNWQPQLRQKSHYYLDRSQRPVYMMYNIQQWLTLVLDLVVGIIAVILIAIITSLRDRFQAASIGVALNLILTLNQSLANAIEMWTMTETSIGAVTRVLRFTQDTSMEEKQCVAGAPALPHDWPSRGAVEIMDVTAGYDHSTTSVLNNVTMSIQPGEKIAVCGPSDSGKTSLVMALLQMLNTQSGSISIDGQDIAQIAKSTLRSRINVIPQDPFFIPGATLRFNLDPHQVGVSHAALIDNLEKVGLWDRICNIGGLEMEFLAADWSVGQRQLLALARALVQKDRKVLILDEATSSIDWGTEAIMQETIEKEFAEHTVVAVVHKLRYIHWFDRVMVIKHGKLVESASAEMLLQRDSEFRELHLASVGGFAPECLG